ncbi:MAG: 2Fe-2S iron-sulfur cluster-binding protein, partial [Actinomycetota bacterium]|nr:2Fe-2S iron-sulfur cluster-binding protein [Actinomycetota bacterium]
MPSTASNTADVSFTPAGRRGTFSPGTTVLEAARSLGVDLDSVCGARGICGRCQVEVGTRPGVSADPARLSAPSSTETGYAGRRPLLAGRRLGCAAEILDDVVIDVPESSQVHRQVVRKDAGRLAVPVDPVIALRYVEVAAPTMQDATGDLQRLRAALAVEWQLADLRFDHSVLTALQPTLERGKRTVTVATRLDREVVAIWPGLRDRVYGVAFDVGSTTLAGHLCDLFSGEVLASSGRM